MVVDVFRLQLPPDLAVGAVEVNRDGHVSSVVVLLEERLFGLLHAAPHDSRACDVHLRLFLGRGDGRTVPSEAHFFRYVEGG